MVWRHRLDDEELYALWRWAQERRLLDQTQEDALSLGLNASSTARHYMAATLGFTYDNTFNLKDGSSHRAENYYRPIPFPHRMTSDLSLSITRDSCVCWCNPHGQGCSALKSLWKAHADWRKPRSSLVSQAQDDMFWRHCLLHHSHPDKLPFSSQANGKHLTAMASELVRLLTFESLDMTHTCCYLEELESLKDNQPMSPAQRKALSAEESLGRRYIPPQRVIATCSPELVEEIRSDSVEQQNARQLEDLMHEFGPHISNMDFSNPRALEIFIWGPWRQRISDLFAIDTQIVAEMEQVVEKVTVTRKFSD
jgi:hypothetical protein